MRVTLSENEVMTAVMVGGKRHYASRNLLKKMATNWGNEIVGALAECAVAKAMNLHWDTSIDVFSVPDVGGSMWVRGTEAEDGRLIIRPGDKPGLWVLVTGRLDTWTLRGWIDYRTSADIEEFETNFGNDGPKAWAIPQDNLRRMEQLHMRRGVALA